MAPVSLNQRFILSGEAAMSSAVAGGKGAALAKLAAKFPVPAFFVIPAEGFDDAGLQAEAKAELADALKTLGAGPFAVRSSGREEDGADSAHAGQFETELNVAAADVPAAAHRVWKSGFSETLAQYRKAKGLSGAPQPPAVVVQVMVKARAAGVAFSADPVSGDRSVAIISAILGLADKLVGGEADGDSYRIATEGGTLEADLVGASPVLTEAERAEVATMARRSEQHFGSPQDIEWAFDAAGLHMLQSRPITTLGPAKTPEPDGELVIWDNSNIVESYPGVTSPLTFSFARYTYAHVYQAFSDLMGVSRKTVEEHRAVFENMLGRVDGRVYYNLLNWYRALALFPGFKANRKFMEGMMGVSEALPQELADSIAPPTDNGFERFLDNLNLARVGAGLIWHEITIKGSIEAFYERLNKALATPNADIDTMSATQLAAEYRNLEQQLLARWDAPLVNDFLCMIAFGAAQKSMTSWAGDDGLAFLSNTLIGQGDIVSAEPARLIRDMGAMVRDRPEVLKRLAAGDRSAVDATPELRAAFDAYIAKFGDRCTQELKLESRSLDEDPAQVLMAIAAAAAPRGAATAETDTRELADLVPQPMKRMLAGWLLKWAKARIRDRENLRFERTRLFGRVRRIFLAMGARLTEVGVLAKPRDVFNLTVDELLGAVEGAGITDDLKALSALREAELKAQLARPDPPERFTVRGAHVVGVAELSAHAVPAVEGGEIRKGLACCKGVVTAKVRVIEDPRVEALLPGEILVARHTDPGWIAVFANAAGVIAERGSLLSHSAIVAREMGVPCVVSLKGVTQWLKTGDTVRLDGGAGTVERTGREAGIPG
ncbi:MAG: PEP/pyruvate-binding domain-containing protein [Hyphomonadaceae bacterium]|nr:PEP/pyruvate-binding domain-containing protein [Hyphomonadaceae bacterium]